LPEGLPETPALPHHDRYGALDRSHPRLWLNGAALADFRAAVAADPDHAGWSAFVAKSARPWLERPLIAEPKPYPNNTRVPA
ncbi:hypothetical protein J8J27_33000, partial [Mycobacterium tuberculosis]|nr:hypothetical protein [Mycobacterium tuberculosis]